MGKVKTVDFSETIAASDLKVSRSSHLKQPPENICQTSFWQTRLVLLVDLEASNDLLYII